MNVVEIPRLETSRLILDQPRVEDFQGYAEIVTSERGRFIGGPLTHEEAWLDFSQMVAGWVLRGYGCLTLRDRSSLDFLGVALVHHEWGDPEPELGWLLSKDAEGRGIGFEAGQAMLNWAFETAGFATLVSYVDSANARASRLAKRLGGVEEGCTEDLITFRYHSPFKQ